MRNHPTRRSGVSVVVCTIGREGPLKACLEALDKQTLRALEIIVVLGPAEVDTEKLFAGRKEIKLVKIGQMNVSASRNAGVKEAAGEIIAFCDDDAIPEPDWLEQLVQAFEGQKVGGCGGKVLETRNEPPSVAFENGLVRLSGRQAAVRPTRGSFNDPRGPWYNNVRGCNCAFRRSVLAEIGGFDEFIEFAYDEADVCVRLIYAGYWITHVPAAVVHHCRAAGGHRRNNIERNWYAEIKNQLYFGLKNRRSPLTALRTILRVWLRSLALRFRFAASVRTGRIDRNQARLFGRDVSRGFLAGLKAGLRCSRPVRGACD